MNSLSFSRKCLVSVLVIFSALALCLLYTKPASAAYDGARLIDDAVFRDSDSMNASQIQAFLEEMNSGLKDRQYKLSCYDADSKERQLYTAAGASCSDEMLASRIIYYASKIYGVNPKVILATLQKEQSLITTTNPTSWQLSQAMGYGCPTSGSCSSSSNFSYQIDSGTWVLRYHYERAAGNNNWWSTSSSWTCGTAKKYYKPSLYPGANTTFMDENGTAYRTHNLANPATSSFYCYTPHAYNNPQGLYGLPKYGTKGMYYSGSYNFVRFFENWFGSTRSSIRLVQCGDDKYLIERSIARKREITADGLTAWGLTNAYFKENDSGCTYPTYSLPLDTQVESRSSDIHYFVNQSTAHRVPNQTIASAWDLGDFNAAIPQASSSTIKTLQVAGALSSHAKSANTERSYLLSLGSIHYLASSPTDTTSARLVSGSSSTPTISGYLSDLKSANGEGTSVNYAFRVGTQWYVFDYGKIRKISSSQYPGRWENLASFTGPTLDANILGSFPRNATITTGFQRGGKWFRVTVNGTVQKTASASIAKSWGVYDAPTVSSLLANKIVNGQ